MENIKVVTTREENGKIIKIESTKAVYNSCFGEIIKITKYELIQKALELKVGEKINFDSINSQNQVYLSYAIEKTEWCKQEDNAVNWGSNVDLCTIGSKRADFH